MLAVITAITFLVLDTIALRYPPTIRTLDIVLFRGITEIVRRMNPVSWRVQGILICEMVALMLLALNMLTRTYLTHKLFHLVLVIAMYAFVVCWY